MKKTIEHYLEDIIEYITRILDSTKEVDEIEFSGDIGLQDMTLRRLEVIGEVAKRIPNEIKEKYREIPWKDITGIRDVIAHDYDGVRMDIVWNVIQIKLPLLKNQIQAILKEIQNR